MMAYPIGQNVKTSDGKGTVWGYSGLWYVVKLDKSGEFKYYTENQIQSR